MVSGTRWFPARFDGECGDCGEPIDEGDDIRRADDDSGWIGRCCGEVEEDE